MTRGTLYYIYKDNRGKVKVVRSVEFNGDMYFDGHGWKVISMLAELPTDIPEEFESKVKEFDKENFKYQDEKGGYFQFHYDKEKNSGFNYFKVMNAGCDRKENYIFIDGLAKYKFKRDDGETFNFDIFSSDHEFFRNATKDMKVIILTKDAEAVTLYPGEVVDLDYMRLNGGFKYFLRKEKE